MRKNWLKAIHNLPKYIIVLKALLALAIEVGLIIAIIRNKWYESYPIITLVISNLITLYLTYKTADIFKKFKLAISNSSMEEKLRMQDERIQTLTDENGKLKHLIDTNSQTIAHFNKINFGVKVELMENTKIGYIVKEEKLEDITTEDLRNQIPKASIFEQIGQRGRDLLGLEQKQQSVLYIDKIYHKSSIGIDLNNIKYAINERNGRIHLCGVELEVLHNTSKDLKHEASDIKHCLIINTSTSGEVSVTNDKDFNSFKEAYQKHHEELAHNAHITQAKELCQQFTQALQSCLQQRYDNLHFVSLNSKEYDDYDWHSLSENVTDIRVMKILTDMHWGVKMIEGSYSEVKKIGLPQ